LILEGQMAEGIYLTQYGLIAERHWREFRPRMVRQMEEGALMETLFEAQEIILNEMNADGPFTGAEEQFRSTGSRAGTSSTERTKSLAPENSPCLRT
jgi:hypothetical protein